MILGELEWIFEICVSKNIRPCKLTPSPTKLISQGSHGFDEKETLVTFQAPGKSLHLTRLFLGEYNIGSCELCYIKYVATSLIHLTLTVK